MPDQTSADEADTRHLMAGDRITVDEAAVHTSATAVWLRQLARALETPDTPVELADDIDSLRRTATELAQRAARLGKIARIIAGDVPLAETFLRGDVWGAAAVDTDRDDFGGPAIIPTGNQLIHLAEQAASPLRGDNIKTVTWAEGMAGVPRSILLSWESKAAADRRRRERNAAVLAEVRLIECESCKAGEGEECRTKTGRIAEQPHRVRQKEAESRVDARLGYVGDNPVAVPHAD